MTPFKAIETVDARLKDLYELYTKVKNGEVNYPTVRDVEWLISANIRMRLAIDRYIEGYPIKFKFVLEDIQANIMFDPASGMQDQH